MKMNDTDGAAGIIETLKQDLPTLFERDISYDIYTQDIFFQDPVNTFKGKFNYRLIFWTLRFHGRLFFTELFFDLHQVSQQDEATILAEWTVRGTLRLPWKPKLLFNGTSTYSLTPEGLINRHIDTWDRSPKEILKQFVQYTANESRGVCTVAAVDRTPSPNDRTLKTADRIPSNVDQTHSNTESS